MICSTRVEPERGRPTIISGASSSRPKAEFSAKKPGGEAAHDSINISRESRPVECGAPALVGDVEVPHRLRIVA
jgi:hypothetical protein